MHSNRRLSPYYAADLNKNVTKSNLPTKICLLSAAGLLFALMLFCMYTGSAVLYIHFWVYVAVVMLILLLLVGAGACAIYNRINSQRARRIAGILMLAVLMLGATMGVAFCQVAALQKPAGFFDSPEGENRIVIITVPADEGVAVTAYPAIGNHFYVAGMESEMVISNGVISGVEWEGERLAKVQMEDKEGNDAEITVDFSVLYDGEEAAE